MDDGRTEWDRMLAGEPYDGAHEVFFAARAACAARKAALDSVPPHDMEGRFRAMQALFGSLGGPCIVQPPFDVEFGTQVSLGAWVFVNSGALFNDCAPITIGEGSMVGPRTMFLTASHPIRSEDRTRPAQPGRMPPFQTVTIAKPIVVERDVWIGAGVIVLPGVTIGEGSVVGAGSVVTRSVPPRVVVAGNPARVIRQIDGPADLERLRSGAAAA
jgi:acetyltransferase-like isoleucine patch superfamily enzyme